jgi:hypothetical protein
MKKTKKELISAKEVCDRTDFDLTTVYQMARSGEIPGAVWGETLVSSQKNLRSGGRPKLGRPSDHLRKKVW